MTRQGVEGEFKEKEKPPKGNMFIKRQLYYLLKKCFLYHNGELLKAWTKSIPTEYPLIAEASQTLWALDLALIEKFQSTMVEGDAKICFDALNGVEN